jgi:DNA polymerase-3 subunit alpha
VIISRDDISDWVPVSTAEDKETGEKLLVTQFDGSVIEDTGLIKMDFLGLKTLSIIKDAVENIRLSRGITIDIDNISLEDEKTYELYSEGKTVGTFQFESAGMQKYLRDLKPSKFEDLIAMNALYRPGPMDYIPQFIARKHGSEAIEYDLPVMERYLKDTYGITVYQEQVMLLSRLLAGFSRGESDELRKAMGKKIREQLDKLRPKFIEGGKKNGYDEGILDKIWADWEKFASYAFNKSHATCYSLVAYQTAWLKANYPSEYMAAVLSRSVNNISDITKFMDECRSMGIQVLGPDINESNYQFTVNKQGNIRFGLGAIKGMGEGAVKAIVEERANKPYDSVFDLVERVNLNACTRKNIEVMALAGAFDSLGEIQREQFFAENDKGEVFLDVLMRYGNRIQLDRASNQNTLFGGEMEVAITRPDIPRAESWSELERLNREKEYVGMYLSSHPLDEYSVFMKYVCNTTIEDIKLSKLELNKEVQFAGIVTEVREKRKQNGDPYAFVTIEDYTASVELPFWSREYVDFGKYLKKDMFLAFRGVYQPRPWKASENELKINSISLLSEAADNAIHKIQITIPLHLISNEFTRRFLSMINKKPGKSLLYITVYDPDNQPKLHASLFSRNYRIQVDKEITDFLEESGEIEIKMN